MRNTWWAKTFRIVAIVLMALTAAFTLMGGAGTTCVTLNPTGFSGKFAAIAPYQWLWVLFVLVGIAAGVLGVRAVVQLVRGSKGAYQSAMIALLIGTVINVIHMFTSRALRGSSMPVDGVLYANVLTLIIFLVIRIPGIWQGVNFEKPAGEAPTGKNVASIALGAVGLLTITIQFLMAPTHTIGGINYADAWHITLSILGSGLVLAGLLSAFISTTNLARRKPPLPETLR